MWLKDEYMTPYLVNELNYLLSQEKNVACTQLSLSYMVE